MTTTSKVDGAKKEAVEEIRVSELVLSPLNVRQYPATGIEELARNIKANSLIQNLTAIEGKKGKYEVTAGGRRLRALQLLVKNGEMSPDQLVPVKVIAAADAAAVSLAENQMREAMTPVDQFRAFASLIEAGRPLHDVASENGVTEAFVKQRMKLAKLAPEVIEALAEQHITLPQAEAFTMTDDLDKQRTLLPQAINGPRYQASPEALRRALTGADIDQTDPRVQFVGVKTIEKAQPAAVSRDLFSDAVFITDEALLDELVLAKLHKHIEQEKAERPWAWCEARPAFGWQEAERFGRIYPKTRPSVDPADKAQLDAIEAEMAALSEAAEESDEGMSDEDEARYEALDAQADELRSKADAKGFTAEEYAVAGAVVTVGRGGSVEWTRGLVRREDSAAASALDPQAKPAKGIKKERPKNDPAGALSEALAVDLSAHHTVALQLAVAQQPGIALRLTCWRLAGEALYSDRNYDAPVLTITGDGGSWRGANIDQASPTASSGTAAKALKAHLGVVKKAMPTKAQLWGWLLEQDDTTVLQVLAAAVAGSVNALREYGKPRGGVEQLHTALGVDMAQHWTPTADTYLGRVPLAAITEAVTEACGAEVAATLPKKKADAVTAAAAALKGKGWLPKPLRAAAVKTPAKAKKAPAKAGKKSRT